MECSVSGCTSKLGPLSSKILFCKLPPNKFTIKKLKKRQLLKALKEKKAPVKSTRVCSKHFKGELNSAILNVDFTPPLLTESGDSLSNIITNIPEITEEFDIPEYVSLANERKIELDLIHKYITNPVCDENGYYINDHDYLGLPILRGKTENISQDVPCDHNYSMKNGPACLYYDFRHFCNICQCNLNLFSFNTHMMMHTIQNDVVCLICGQKFFTTSCLNNHMTTHKTICDICGTEVPIVQILAHQEANKQQKREFIANGSWYRVKDRDKVNFCIFCMKSIPNNYLQHLASHNVQVSKVKREKNQHQQSMKRERSNLKQS